MEKLNDELNQMAIDYLNGCNSVYGLWFEEVDAPDEADIQGKVEDPDEEIETYVKYAIWEDRLMNENYSDDIPVQIKNMIMQTLGSYDAQLYDLSARGREETYVDDESNWDHIYGLVRIQGNKEHWYTSWYSWSD